MPSLRSSLTMSHVGFANRSVGISASRSMVTTIHPALWRYAARSPGRDLPEKMRSARGLSSQDSGGTVQAPYLNLNHRSTLGRSELPFESLLDAAAVGFAADFGASPPGLLGRGDLGLDAASDPPGFAAEDSAASSRSLSLFCGGSPNGSGGLLDPGFSGGSLGQSPFFFFPGLVQSLP